MMAERAGTKTRATLLAQVTPVQKEIQTAERSTVADAAGQAGASGSAAWEQRQSLYGRSYDASE